MESLYLVSLGDQRFSSVTSIIQFLDSLPSNERYQAQKLVADQLSIRRHVVGEELLSFLDYVVMDQAWSSEITIDQFTAEWQPFQEIAQQVKRERNKLTEVKRTIEARWRGSATSIRSSITSPTPSWIHSGTISTARWREL
jgi:hypothetical protein